MLLYSRLEPNHSFRLLDLEEIDGRTHDLIIVSLLTQLQLDKNNEPAASDWQGSSTPSLIDFWAANHQQRMQQGSAAIAEM